MSQTQGAVTETLTRNASRKITVKPTRGESKVIEFEGNSWADLKPLLEQNGYNLSNMKCVESIKKNTLEHPKAILPEGDFNLFLIPLKSKSGGSRAEVYRQITDLIAEHGTIAKEYFNGDQNYTRKSTSSLEELIESFKPGSKTKVARQRATAISDIVDSVKNSTEVSEIHEHLLGLSNDEKIDIIIELLVTIKQNSTIVTTKANSSSISQENKESEEERSSRVQKENKERADKELQDELEDVVSGFED